MIAEMNSLIIKIQFLKFKAINEGILDKEIEDSPIDLETEDEPITDFDEKEDLELAKALEEALSLFTLPTEKSVFYIGTPTGSTLIPN